MHAVAPDRMHVGCVCIEPFDDVGDVGAVVFVVKRIRLWHADHVAGLDAIGIDEPQQAQLALALFDQLRVGLVPGLITFEHEILETEARPALFHQIR